MAMTLDDIKACLQAGGFQIANEVASIEWQGNTASPTE